MAEEERNIILLVFGYVRECKHAILSSDSSDVPKPLTVLIIRFYQRMVKCKLSVFCHCGHYHNLDKCHPRNLLQGPKSGPCRAWSYYTSVQNLARGRAKDWIIFCVDSPVMPCKIRIQNSAVSYGVGIKCIPLSM